MENECNLVTKTSENKFKLTLCSNFELVDSVLETPRDYEEFDVFIDINSDVDFQKLKKIYQQHGANVKKLSWSNYCRKEFTNLEIIEMLNYLPNLKHLEFTEWHKEFIGNFKDESLNLPNVSHLEINESSDYIIDFLGKALCKNIIETLNINLHHVCKAKYATLIANQNSIKKLYLHGPFGIFKPLESLQIEKLHCLIYKEDSQSEAEIFESFRSFIKTQSELKELNLLKDCSSNRTFSFVDDEGLECIYALPKLEKLSICVDKISPSKIKHLSYLKTLTFLLLNNREEESLPIFVKFGEQKMLSLEELILDLKYFEIPTETLEAFGRNFEKLKTLKIESETKQNINFFARVFLNLENLNVEFSSFEFDFNDNFVHTNLKKIDVCFTRAEITDGAAFVDMLGMFPNLEVVNLKSELKFSSDIINQIATNIRKIKTITISNFKVLNDETFPAETATALKLLRSKVDSISLTLLNVQSGHRWKNKKCQPINYNFTYQPLIDELKDTYIVNEYGISNIRTFNFLRLEAGCENNVDELLN